MNRLIRLVILAALALACQGLSAAGGQTTDPSGAELDAHAARNAESPAIIARTVVSGLLGPKNGGAESYPAPAR